MQDRPVTEEIQNFVNTVIEMSGLHLEAEVAREAPELIHVELSGEDCGLLLGRNGELLNSLEYLANKVYARSISKDARITFDAAGFRSTRERELRMMAAYAAARVRSSRRPFSFEPMPPTERRILHLVLVDEPGVRTESLGEGDDRKVVVYPV